MENIKGYQIQFIPETDSTNAEARRMIQHGYNGHKLLIWTDFQHAGRGQRTNHWESEKAKNLLFTLCVQPSFLLARQQFLLSEAVSLAVCTTFNTIHPGFTIKWPNDIYHQENKVCGILIEQVLQSTHISQSLIGIGININQTIFRSDAPNPTSLSIITHKEHSRHAILEQFLEHFCHYYQLLENQRYQQLQQAYHEHLFRSSGPHLFKDEKGVFEAYIQRVEDSGQLILLTSEGQQRSYTFKEVKYIFQDRESE